MGRLGVESVAVPSLPCPTYGHIDLCVWGAAGGTRTWCLGGVVGCLAFAPLSTATLLTGVCSIGPARLPPPPAPSDPTAPPTHMLTPAHTHIHGHTPQC